jgi:hypothetical protein
MNHPDPDDVIRHPGGWEEIFDYAEAARLSSTEPVVVVTGPKGSMKNQRAENLDAAWVQMHPYVVYRGGPDDPHFFRKSGPQPIASAQYYKQRSALKAKIQHLAMNAQIKQQNERKTDQQSEDQKQLPSSNQQPQGKNIQKSSIFRAPDYVSGNLNIAILNPWTATLVGITLATNVDRDGDLYFGVGPTLGKSATLISGSVTVDWLDQKSKPDSQQIHGFLTRHSFSGTAGFWGGVQQSYTPGSGWATGVGFVTPQAGVSYTYSWIIHHFKIHW